MTRFPREPLDADERALAAALPRSHGRAEPDAAMDARILAAAHAAAQAPAATTPRTRRWAVPLGLAASLCLALGLAWRTQIDAPPRNAAPAPQVAPTLPATSANPPMPAADANVAAPLAKSGSAATVEPLPPPPPAAIARAAPVPPPIAQPAAPDAPPVMLEMRPAPAMAAPLPAPVAAAPPPPPAPPAPPPIASADAAGAFTSEAMPSSPRALAPAPAAAKARSAEPARRELAAQADAPIEDVPPATADSPDVRNAWLRRIGELMQEGKWDLARASLAEFRRRYPDAAVPAELRPLETPPASEPATH